MFLFNNLLMYTGIYAQFDIILEQTVQYMYIYICNTFSLQRMNESI